MKKAAVEFSLHRELAAAFIACRAATPSLCGALDKAARSNTAAGRASRRNNVVGLRRILSRLLGAERDA